MPGIDSALIWAAVALALGAAELLMPGVFLVFLAIGAGLTAAIALAMPELPLAAELAAFGVWSTATVLIGRRWYHDFSPDSDDALLNDRGGRLIGQVVTIEVAITDGHGRVRVGDGAWPATGEDMAAGARARVRAIEHGVIVVEALKRGDGALGD